MEDIPIVEKHTGLYQAALPMGRIKKRSTAGIFNLGFSLWDLSFVWVKTPEPYFRNGWLGGDWWLVHTGQRRPPCCWSPISVRYPRTFWHSPQLHKGHNRAHVGLYLSEQALLFGQGTLGMELLCFQSWDAQPALGPLLYDPTYFRDKNMNIHHCSVSQWGKDMPA